jgi:hypothetical protein
MPVVMQMKVLPDGNIAYCTGMSGAVQDVSFVVDSENGGSAGNMPFEEWDALDDYTITIGKGRSGHTIYEYARKLAQDHDLWDPWELLTIAQMRVWKKLAEALDKGDV